MSEQEWIRDEQGHLWFELKEALDDAIDKSWSIRASQIALRIIGAARLVGPNDHGGVPWALVAGGVYEAVLRAGNLRVTLPDEAEWLRLDTMMSKQNNVTAAWYKIRYAATVLHIARDAEWLSQ